MLVQVMAGCCQATNHYLNQYWPSFVTPYGITGPKWVWSTWYNVTTDGKWHTGIYLLYICWGYTMNTIAVYTTNWVHGLFFCWLTSPGQNGHHFVDNIFRCICMNEKFCTLINPAFGLDNDLVQIIWQAIIWTNDGLFTDTCICHSVSMSWGCCGFIIQWH